ncbi:MAG: hypothetical protein AB7Q37_17065 [Pyrinomonadaceae bacterium]
MMLRIGTFSIIIFACSVAAFGQTPPSATPTDANSSMAYDISRIAASVQQMTSTLKDFVDKFAKVEGITLAEKQQRLVAGMQLLIQAEQRAAGIEKRQIELVEKEGQLRARLVEVENELNPQSIDRSVALEGSTQTPEIKEARRRALQAERTSLSGIVQQLQVSLRDAANDLREAQLLVFRLRRTFLPQVERELSEQ